MPELREADYYWIAGRIFANETGGKLRYLVHWNEGEDFPSMGIGHFIWFPEGVDAPFDESFPTMEKRFKTVDVESTEENRRSYREMLFRTPGVESSISGVILFDETGRALTEVSQIEVVGNDRYVSLCRRHWREALGDRVGAALTRQNLGMLPPPPAPPPATPPSVRS